VSVFSALVFLVLGSGLEQSWAKDPSLDMEVDVSVGDAAEDSSESTMECHDQITTNGHIIKESTSNGQPKTGKGLGFRRRSVQFYDECKPKMISQSVQVNFGYGEINLSFDMNETIGNVQISNNSPNSEVCLSDVSNIGEEMSDTSEKVRTNESFEFRRNKYLFSTSTLKINDTKREVTVL
jgi:hypothetical protein